MIILLTVVFLNAVPPVTPKQIYFEHQEIKIYK
jgi:hypothetical protein